MENPACDGTPSAEGIGSGPQVVFTADFTSTRQWVAGRSWAYPNGGPVNPGDNKLDHLTADPAYSRSGTFRATLRKDGLWNTGLLTTEGSEEGFTVRAGDELEARVRLPHEAGAWPAIWTWRDGGQEIDVFEYHPDNPDLLELTNHVRGANSYYRDPAVRPGGWVDLRVRFGSRSVVWWVNGTRVFADRQGVGRFWHAYLIVNLSVCAGRYHPPPAPYVKEMSYEVQGLVVRRPATLAQAEDDDPEADETGAGSEALTDG
ncbi:family 16 glycosylhydrolase [Streptomyces hilarionis]|uniref:family 16 glycosylhydrolase n=1 Tax=Streptomyces hilarionis TaxID=2839954 RepID=UPI00211A658B|nr:family 16 glycosylhydrolase [Streptomyces hilarionis]MCQ9133729.1 family 16 glycosylhydrolase [Streptomyces hilarionis]